LISRHGADITLWAYVVVGAIALASLLVVLPFCRWLCPLAAVLNPFSRFGLGRITRNPQACRDCGACSKSCPALIPVDQLDEVRAARCTSCMSCIDACPHSDSGAISWGIPSVLGPRWPQAALVAVLLLCTSAAVAASYLFPLPSFVKAHGTRPEQVAKVKLRIDGVSCRGRANLLCYFLERDDMYGIPGYFKVEAWPGPGVAEVHVTYDPSLTGEAAIREAISEPYYDVLADYWRMSPFLIEGYDPLGLDVPLPLEAAPGSP
jgi:hypothetical protein